MTQSAPLTNKGAYETRGESGEITGAIGPRDWNRFKQTLRLIPPDTRSLLDAGCDRGHWLDFVHSRRSLQHCLGVDISEGRIEEAKRAYPHLPFQAGYLEQLDIAPGTYEVVTSLEVLEHIPDWIPVLDSLLAVAGRRVVVTVPYREKIDHVLCIHCGNLAPRYGHLRVYDESTFPQRSGWKLSLDYIMDYGINMRLLTRVYRTLRPRRNWLVACYDRMEATVGAGQ